jgi:16S rRNA U1498 N3-methylase RsmE
MLGLYPTVAAWLAAKPWQAAPLLVAADNVEPSGTFSGLGQLKLPSQGPCAVLAVGAERGWSGREREQLEAAGFVRLSMGKRALRTETACTAAAILLMEKMGLLD